ncbi:hypothetical protein [Gelidibacter salicanalis]|uniref:Uncharacterized protein n=1 Tax=Gelidibacter salicanalis TaxID=291193 RepID=A0A934KSV2_9FLAO|nr:hypothetical protein [Gelidibacter salicanalis]MBJ7880751.1 hypothetical protein [Gelidibacter salicanalis]
MDKIIRHYGFGMSYRGHAHTKEMYDIDNSRTVSSQFTDRIIPDVKGMAEPTSGSCLLHCMA